MQVLLFAASPLPVILDCALKSARAMREVLGSMERQTSKPSSRRTRTRTGRITGWSSYLRPWEGDGTCPPAAASRHLKDKKGMAEPKWRGERGACCVQGFCKAFHMVSRGVLIARLVLSGLKKWTLRWVGSWLDDQAQILSVVQSPPCSQLLAASLSDQHLGQHC